VNPELVEGTLRGREGDRRRLSEFIAARKELEAVTAAEVRSWARRNSDEAEA
jgi:hypothetical protein